MYLLDLDFCETSSSIWQLIGYALFALKTVIPIIVIILGIVDFSKASVTGDDDGIKKSAVSLLRRFVLGIVVFFIPLIVSVVFSLISKASSVMAEIEPCQVCLLDPTGDKCDTYKEKAKTEREQRNNDLKNGVTPSTTS